MAFTIVFEGNLRHIEGNPLKLETAFGKPIVSSIGDLSEECDKLREALEAVDSKICLTGNLKTIVDEALA
jgi:hypothetical protein